MRTNTQQDLGENDKRTEKVTTLRTKSLKDSSTISQMEMYLKNRYELCEVTWNSKEECYEVKFTK